MPQCTAPSSADAAASRYSPATCLPLTSTQPHLPNPPPSSLVMYPISLSYTLLHIGGLYLAKAPPTSAAVHTRSESKPLQNYPAAPFANAFMDRTTALGI